MGTNRLLFTILSNLPFVGFTITSLLRDECGLALGLNYWSTKQMPIKRAGLLANKLASGGVCFVGQLWPWADMDDLTTFVGRTYYGLETLYPNYLLRTSFVRHYQVPR
ncbi:MAG: hypothetical protein AAF702_12445 [Chloroflexota bacterium]